MRLKDLLIGLSDLKARGNLDIDIKGVACNSNKVKQGDLFVAIKGFEKDGHKFINEAIKNGATAILIEEGCDLKSFKVKSDTVVIMNMYGASPADYAGDKFSELIVLLWCRSQKK